jgi:putative sigma-54 modulation protein
MNITYIGRQVNVYEDQKQLVEKKLAKFDRYFPGQADATVTFRKIRDNECMEITISVGNTLFRAEEQAEKYSVALTRCIDVIEGQIRKNKTRLERRLRQGAFERVVDAAEISSIAPDEPEEGEYQVVRTKSFPIKPMTRDEAILQMNLLGHNFFAFRDQDAGDVFAVVYRRYDGDYGLIEDEEG